jgi:hypothetical protein
MAILLKTLRIRLKSAFIEVHHIQGHFKHFILVTSNSSHPQHSYQISNICFLQLLFHSSTVMAAFQKLPKQTKTA